MGEAKRREPDKAKRIAQGIGKEKIRAAERDAEYKRKQAEYQQYLKDNPKARQLDNVVECLLALASNSEMVFGKGD